MKQKGILMPIFSLPSPYGIGTMGKSAYRFIDYLKDNDYSYWQVLPIGPTGYGDSPYQSLSSYAINPYFIDFDEFSISNINWGDDENKVDYGLLFNNKFRILRDIYNKYSNKIDIEEFATLNPWVIDYARYMTLKEKNNYVCWNEFKIIEDNHDPFYIYVQLLAFNQWKKLKEYANNKGIKIIGDLPIYVAFDSVDIFSSKEQFLMNENLPLFVAGCPPDDFSKDGQLWGNPIYNWEYMKQTNFKWLVDRIKHQMELFDVLRLDHFIGYERYYKIPFGALTAKEGHYEKGYGKEFFTVLKRELPNLDLILEDLGIVTREVEQLISFVGFPGTRVLQFGLDNEGIHNPKNYNENVVCYSSTHDNDTLMSWYEGKFGNDKSNLELIQMLLDSKAKLAVITMQDVLGMKNGRINTPGTCNNNWCYRFSFKPERN